MRLGTMTSLFRDRRECAEHFGYIESVQRCRKAGFTVLDMNLCALNRRQTTLHLDNWQEQVDEIRNEAERLGCVFSQSHPPYRRGREGTFATAEEEAFFRAMSLRALEITAMLGAKWAVIHPVMDVTADINDVDAHVRYNQQMFAREAELAAKKAAKKAKKTVTVQENGKEVTKEVNMTELNKMRLEYARQQDAELYKNERTTPLKKED